MFLLVPAPIFQILGSDWTPVSFCLMSRRCHCVCLKNVEYLRNFSEFLVPEGCSGTQFGKCGPKYFCCILKCSIQESMVQLLELQVEPTLFSQNTIFAYENNEQTMALQAWGLGRSFLEIECSEFPTSRTAIDSLLDQWSKSSFWINIGICKTDNLSQ